MRSVDLLEQRLHLSRVADIGLEHVGLGAIAAGFGRRPTGRHFHCWRNSRAQSPRAAEMSGDGGADARAPPVTSATLPASPGSAMVLPLLLIAALLIDPRPIRRVIQESSAIRRPSSLR